MILKSIISCFYIVLYTRSSISSYCSIETSYACPLLADCKSIMFLPVPIYMLMCLRCSKYLATKLVKHQIL